MREPQHHNRLRHDAIHVGQTDRNQVITGYICIRRRLDHAPIPSFDEFVGCKPRKRLDEDEFTRLYGASDEDINAIKAHYETIGFHSVEHRAVSRTITLTGNPHHFNTAFNVTLNDYDYPLSKGRIFRGYAHATAPMIPDHLYDHILLVEFDLQPVRSSNLTHPPVVSQLTLTDLKGMYNCLSNKATGQIIGIAQLPGWGDVLDSDINASCDEWSVSHPTIQRINVNTFTDTGTETTLDVTMVSLFGEGCTPIIYKANSIFAAIARMAHPFTSDPICTITNFSAVQAENGSSGANSFFQDAAIQGVTSFASSGDWGTTDGEPGTAARVAAAFPASSPWVTAVGGTVIGANSGTVSSTNFVEWAWNELQYFSVSGGGVSVEFATPSYQSGITIPATVSTITAPLNGSPGRGEPDIAANAALQSGIKYVENGNPTSSGGTSQSSPICAGMFARVNAALGHNLGLINPTLYAGDTAFMRKVNSGGSVDNKMVDSTGTFSSGFFPSYPVTLTGWNAVVGLGMPNVGNFLHYVRLASAAPGSFIQDFTLVSTNMVESANQTIIKTKGPQITGFDLTTYAIGSSGAILVNGTSDPTTSNAVELYYLNHYVYYQASNGIWLTKRLIDDAWVQTWDPVIQIATPAKQYFINSTTGNDGNTGKAANLAFATFAAYAAVAGPGTVANVAGNTTYTAGAFFSAANSGTVDNRCVIQWDGIGAKPIVNIATTDGNGFVVWANWFDIIGIVVQGTNQQVTFQQAKDFATAGQSPNICNQIGFNYGQRGNRVIQHHVRVMNCEFYDCGASGININFADYVVVVNNIVARCSWYSIFGSSGISIYGSHDIDTVTVYKTYVANNICYENQQKVPTNGGTDYTANGITDGENIILDDNSNDQTDSVAYNGRTLVVGNQCSLSGRSNIQAFAGSNADILFNTCYGANQVISTDGQIYMHNYSGTNHVENNILYATTAGDSTIKIDAGSGTTSDFNLHFTTGTASATNTGTHDVTGQDPLFTDIANRNFKVGSTSPARNKADPVWCYNVLDAAGISRPRLNATLGAYQ